MGVDLYVDPERRYVMQRPTGADRALRLWTVERLRFHTSQPPWQQKLALELVDEIRSLPLAGAEVLRGVFVSDARDLVDAENVLFYNLHGRSFANAPQHLRFERSWEPAPAPPVELAAPPRYHHIYEGVVNSDGFRSWELSSDDLARWERIDCADIAGDRRGWRVWRAMREAQDAVEVRSSVVQSDFGIAVSVRAPPGIRLSAIAAIKGALDGVIASFQRYPVGSIRAQDAAFTLGAALGHPSSRRTLGWLTDASGRLFAEPPFNARGRLALNPCDDRCLAGELAIVVDPTVAAPVISGRLATVVPTEDRLGPT
jgi:hypothetical protein